MDIEKYIASGILELYVAGGLAVDENKEIHRHITMFPEIAAEVERIEKVVVILTASAAPKNVSNDFNRIEKRILPNSSNPKNTNWFTYTGWAAAVLLTAGMVWAMVQNNKLQDQLNNQLSEKQLLEEQMSKANLSLAEAQKLNTLLRQKDIQTINLPGQAVSPSSFAKVYWNQKSAEVYVDLQGLPEPPSDKVYQIWSLTLDPLTPTSIGIINDFMADDNKIFELTNNNKSQAFGITLEPKGGSESPTMEQLYTFGAVSAP